MAKIPRIERLLNLVSFLLCARKPAPWAEIRERVAGYRDAADPKTLERRFERDKAELRDMGLPIEYTPADEFGNEGYFISKVDCFLPPIDLAADDAAALGLIGRLGASGLPPDLAEPLRSAVRKLSCFASDDADVLASPEEHLLLTAHKHSDMSAMPAHLDAFVAAVAERKTVQFQYYAISRDATSQRTVDPYGVGFHAGNWYLVGLDHARGEIRSYRLDRVRSQPTRRQGGDEPDFDPPEGFRLSDHLGREAWELPEGANVTHAKIRLDPTVAWMVRDNPPRNGRLVEAADGSAELSLHTQRPDALVRWVLRLTTHAEVLSPAWLRQRCANAARRTAALYEGGRDG